MAVEKPHARAFYEAEAIRGGWSVRQLDRQISTQFFVGKFTHADAGQMNLYLNYVREQMMEPGESDPVGLVLCSAKNDAVVHYAMGGIKAQVFASHYLTALPDAETLRQEILTAQHALEARAAMKGPDRG
jgi:hypothetical protein